MAVCTLLALVMLVDFCFSGKTQVEEVISTHKNLERYHNAGGNSNFSFWIQTNTLRFPVSEHFASLAKEAQVLKINVSPIFREVNSYEILETGEKEVYSFRVFSGLLLPVLLLVGIGLGYSYKKKVSTFVFVVEALTIANLAYLLQ